MAHPLSADSMKGVAESGYEAKKRELKKDRNIVRKYLNLAQGRHLIVPLVFGH